MQRSHVQQLALAPLGPDAIRELLEDLLGTDPSTAGLAGAIHGRTGGNPFFAEELVRSLIESGHLAGERGRYRLATPVEKLPVPDTVQAVLAARIDRLAEREKAVLQAAAVIGKEFSEPILRAALEARREEPALDLAAALATLKRAEFVYEESLYPVAEYAFKHPLTQEVAYRTLLGEQRARTHAAVARALELERGAQGEAAAVIAYHWESAGEPVHAARWHDRAASWIENRVPAEAARHWRRVRELLGDAASDPELAALALAACTSLLSYGPSFGLGDAEAAALFTEGMQLARRFPNASGESRLIAAHGRYLVSRGAAPDALGPVEEAVRRARESGDAGSQLRALETLAYLQLNLGRLLPALAAADEAVALLDSASSGIEPREGARILVTRVVLLTLAGRLRPAGDSLQRAEPLLPAGNDLLLGLYANSVAFLAWQRGDARAAASHAERALDYAGRTGSAALAAVFHWTHGRAQLLLGDFAGALHSLEQALATGAMLNVEGFFLAGIALAHLGLGDPERARRTAEHAIAVARQRTHAISECYAYGALARILTQTEGARAAAEIDQALCEGERLVAETGARCFEPFFHEERARRRRRPRARARRSAPPLHRDGRDGLPRTARSGVGASVSGTACGAYGRADATCGARRAELAARDRA
jgi:adenylate cyclase